MPQADTSRANPTIYTVQPGDTLSAIAQGFYGDLRLWTVIFDANRPLLGEDPNRLFPHTALTIPAPPERASTATAAQG
jgi:nucleoid-associated protein YgaU